MCGDIEVCKEIIDLLCKTKRALFYPIECFHHMTIRGDALPSHQCWCTADGGCSSA